MMNLFNFHSFLVKLTTFGIDMDANLVMSDAQAQTSVATHACTTAMDFGVANPNVGVGTPIWCTVAVQTALSGASGTTLQLRGLDAADGSTYTMLWATSVGTAAGFAGAATSIFTVAAGTKLWDAPMPATVRRYFKVEYIIGTTVLASGKFDAYLHLGGA